MSVMQRAPGAKGAVASRALKASYRPAHRDRGMSYVRPKVAPVPEPEESSAISEAFLEHSDTIAGSGARGTFVSQGHRELLASVLSDDEATAARAAANCHVFSRQPPAAAPASGPDERLRQVLLGQVTSGLAKRVPKGQQRAYAAPAPLDAGSDAGIAYLAGLETDVTAALQQGILDVDAARDPLGDQTFVEAAANAKACRDLAAGAERAPEVEGIASFMREPAKAQGSLLVVCGDDGCGKGTALACALVDNAAWAKRNNVLVVYRRVGATMMCDNLRTLLVSACRQLCRVYGESGEADVPEALKDIVPQFSTYLRLAGPQKRLVLAIDGLDHLPATQRQLRWLPRVLPPGVTVVLSATLQPAGVHATLAARYNLDGQDMTASSASSLPRKQVGRCTLLALKPASSAMIASMHDALTRADGLQRSRKELAVFRAATGSARLPLHALVCHELLRLRAKSGKGETEVVALPNDLFGAISDLFHELEDGASLPALPPWLHPRALPPKPRC